MRKLLYLTLIRLNITYVVNVVSPFMHAPRHPHLKAVERILRYNKSCPGKDLLFNKSDNLNVEGYADIDLAGSLDDG